MVSLTSDEIAEQVRTVKGSVDRAIKDLGSENRDPVAVATYLWVVQRRHVTLANGDLLTNWGRAWIREALLPESVDRRADERLASGALAAVALHGTSAVDDVAELIRGRLRGIIRQDWGRSTIPVGQPSYAAMILLAGTVYGVGERKVDDGLDALTAIFLASIPSGRLVGLPMFLCALERSGKTDTLAQFVSAALAGSRDPAANYENRMYLAEAVCSLETQIADASEVYNTASSVVMHSPMWSHLLNGQEDIPEIGDKRSVVTVSHLYRAALLDVSVYLEERYAAQREAALDQRYGGRRAATIPAFVLYATVSAVFWWAVFALVLAPHAQAAEEFWLLHHYDGRAAEATVILGVLIVSSYAIPINFVFLHAAAETLLGSGSESYARILDRFRPRAARWTRLWLPLICVGLIVGVVLIIIGPGITHLLG